MDEYFSRQVTESHYNFNNYMSFERWCSIYYQLNEVVGFQPKNVLIIGVGDGIVPAILRSYGVSVVTFDFDDTLKPDFLGDVRNISTILSDHVFDVVLCCQVLEHIPYKYFIETLNGLCRVSRKAIVISLPYRHNTIFRCSIKIPFVNKFTVHWSIPRFWQKWEFDGEHYWEIGTKEYPESRICNAVQEVSTIIKKYFSNEYRYHLFYVLKGKTY